MHTARKLATPVMLLALACTGLTVTATATASPGESVDLLSDQDLDAKDMRLWYDEPAPSNNGGWMDRSIPMGNGYMGANVFGGTETERIQITENSLADANPYVSPDRVGGLNNFAEMYLDFDHTDVTDYVRELVLDEGVSRVRYTSGGVEYEREYFTSYPDKVLAVRLTASQAGKLSFTLRPRIPHLADYRIEPADHRGKSGTVVAKGDTITLSGVMEYYNVQYEGQFKVLPEGGTIEADNDASNDNGTITVSGADSAVILVAVGTNYQLDPQVFTSSNRLDKLAGFPHPHDEVTQFIADASAKSYDELLAAHQEDYTELYDRVDFDLRAPEPTIPTDDLIDAYRGGDRSAYLEELAFQFGRYLLISSSREGALPPNLQGVWNVYQDPPWGSGYWHNLNQQMNYSPAFSTNLSETFESYIDFYQAYLPRQQELATEYIDRYNPSQLDPGGNNGWAMGNSAWPYQGAGKTAHSGFGTGAWTAMMFWDYYDYTRNEDLLEDVVYPALYGQSNFLSRFVTDHDGLLLADPSSSPENANSLQSVGTTFDQQMIYENHRNTLKAAALLGEDGPILDKLERQLPKLDPIVIGRSGQIKEYREEEYYGDIGDPHHRHISHLLGLAPGQLIDRSTPAWLDAARVSLEGRGSASVGWANAERIGKWARLEDGAEKAFDFYSEWLKENVMHNLFDDVWSSSSQVFQVDGNFGATASVSDMLLQSSDYVVAPLPALPDAWSDGSYRGLVARGNFEVSAAWSDGHADQIDILSKSGGSLTVRYVGIQGATVRTAAGEDVVVAADGTDQITFDTTEGATYVVTDLPTVDEVGPPADLNAAIDVQDVVKFRWTASDDESVTYNLYRADGSDPDYERVASGIAGTSYAYHSDDLAATKQSTFRVTAMAADGRESDGTTAVRLLPEQPDPRVLRVDDDVVAFGPGDGEKSGEILADGAYTLGLTWRSGLLTEVRLKAAEDGEVTLREEMFTPPVRVYRADGRPVDFGVDGDTLTLTTGAGQSYRIVAQAEMSIDLPAGTKQPGVQVPVSLKVEAADQLTLPATTAGLRLPDGWSMAPAQVRLEPIKPGASRTAEFTVSVPAGTANGRYPVTGILTSDEWSLRAPVAIEVLRPNLALHKPATQSTTGFGGVPERAVDGDTNGVWSGGSVTHTTEEHQPWWQVDLGAVKDIEEINIWNRTDCCSDRLSDYYVLVSDAPFVSGSLEDVLAQPGVWAERRTEQPDPDARFDVGRSGRYVRVQLAGRNYLTLAEVEVFPPAPR